jgi:hypothetical protein
MLCWKSKMLPVTLNLKVYSFHGDSLLMLICYGVIAQCGSVQFYRCFVGTCSFRLEGPRLGDLKLAVLIIFTMHQFHSLEPNSVFFFLRVWDDRTVVCETPCSHFTHFESEDGGRTFLRSPGNTVHFHSVQ